MTDHEPRIQELKDTIIGLLDSLTTETSDSTTEEAEEFKRNAALVEELCSLCMDIPN